MPLVILSFLAAGCSVDLANPPRLATATARAAATPTPSPVPVVLQAPTATPGLERPILSDPASGSGRVPVLSVWVNETSPEHRQVLDEIVAEFSAQSGADVAIQLVSTALLPQLVNTAVLSDTLPDVILHPIEYTPGWEAQGILDGDAIEAVLDTLEPSTFDPEALALAAANGQLAALPVDGYFQLILYRSDWFRERGLPPPDTYTAMQMAAERIFDQDAVISGLVIPTESNLVTTHQAFEQIALANNCRLIDEAGEVTILDSACAEALDFYFSTINQFSPPGVQTDTSARNALLEGRTGIIMTSPAILPILAGLDSRIQPSCAECVTDEDGINSLARNTGILTTIRGVGSDAQAASFGNIRNIGITTKADREVAQDFVRYWFTDGYEKWLSVDSERKVPMRLGTETEPRRFIDAWGETPLGDRGISLETIYGEETIARLRDGVAAAPRWGIREGHGTLMTRVYDELTFSIVLQEMLSGYFNSATTLKEAYRRVVDLIPNYSFPVIVDEEETAP